MLRRYIGTKIILAEPMTRGEFIQLHPTRALVFDDIENKDEKGYKVVYPDGYESWSPIAVFEAAYREVTDEEMSILLNGAQAL